MKTMVLARPVFIAVALASVSLAVRFAVSPPPLVRLESVATAARRGGSVTRVSPVSADSLARAVAARDIFRASRRPAAVPFNPLAVGATAPTPPAIPLPPLRLSGILAGADTSALVDGFPGSDATRVVRAGDRIGLFTVRLIAADRVVIAGRDTTWTLRLRTP